MKNLPYINQNQIKEIAQILGIDFYDLYDIAVGKTVTLSVEECKRISENEDRLEGLLPWIMFPSTQNVQVPVPCYFAGPNGEKSANLSH